MRPWKGELQRHRNRHIAPLQLSIILGTLPIPFLSISSFKPWNMKACDDLAQRDSVKEAIVREDWKL